MKVKFSIYILWFLGFFIGCAPIQQEEKTINYSQVEALKDKADNYYKEKNYQEALSYYNQAIKAGKQFQFQNLVAQSYNGRGRSYYKMQNYVESILSYEKAIDIYFSLNDLDNLAKNVFNLGLTYKKQNINEQALVAYLEAYRHFESAKQEKRVATVCNAIGLIYKRLEKYEEAITFYKESEEIRKRLGDQKGLARTLQNMGHTYLVTKDYKNALSYLEKTKILKEEIGNKKSLTITYSELGQVHLLTNDLKKAEEYYLKSFLLSLKRKDKNYILINTNKLGLIYTKTGNYTEARKYLKLGNQIGREIQDHEYLLENHQYSIILNEREGNFEKIELHQTHILEQQKKLIFNKLEIEKKSDQIAQKLKNIKAAISLTKEEEEKKHEAKTLMKTTIGGIAVVLLAGFVFYDKKTKMTTRLDKPLFGLTKDEELHRVYLKEAHHRSKNNMMVLSGVVTKNLTKIRSKSDRLRFLETQNWYETILWVNKKLGNAHEGIITHIDLEEFIEDIIERAIDSTQTQLHYELNLKKIKIDHIISLPLGVVINEIIARIINDVLFKVKDPELKITAKRMSKKRLSLTFKGNAATLPKNTKENIELLLESLQGYIIEKEQECIIELQISE